MKRHYTILLFFLIIPSVYSLEITELLPNPTGDDNAPMPGGEYIELYNPSDSQIDLEGYYFLDALQNKLIISDNTTLDNTTIQPNSLKVIYRNQNTKFSLNNDKDTIYFYDKLENLIEIISYNQTKENNSISKIDNAWVQAPPTPGVVNKISENVPEDRNCDYNLNVESQDLFYQNKINFTISVEKVSGIESNFILKRYIKDKDNIIVKDYQDLKLFVSSKKNLEYSPTLSKQGEYTIYSSINTLDCSNNQIKEYTKTFEIILKEDEKISKNSSIEILDINPKNISFGQTIEIKIRISKYNTLKNLVTISIHDQNKKQITEKIGINLFHSNYEIVLDLPYQLKDYCNSGTYYLIVEGLEEKIEKKIYINNAVNCINKTKKEALQTETKYESNLNTNQSDQEVVYKDVSQKSRECAPVLFIFVLILIIIKLLKKND